MTDADKLPSDAPKPSGGLGRASALMASGSMVSRVLGIVRNALMVAIVGGETTASAAFNTANTLPNQIFALLQGGLLTTLFLPQLTKAMARKDGGEATVNALLTWCYLAVGAVAVLATALAYPLSRVLQLNGPALDLGVAFAFICLPQIFFYGIYSIWSQVLYARDRFGITMWATVFANLVQIAGMVMFLSRFTKTEAAERWTPEMIALLGGTFTLGIAVQALALLPALRRAGFAWRPNFSLHGHGFRTTARLASWTIAAVTIAQLGGFVTTAAINNVTSHAERGIPNYTVYLLAFQMFFVPHGIVTISILTAIFPRLTRSYQAGDLPALRADVTRSLRLPLLAMVPLTAAAMALSVPGMSAVTPSLHRLEAEHTGLTFSLMALGLVPYAVSGLQQRYSMAREDGRTNLWFTAVVTGVQIAAAGAILFLPRWAGVYTVAIGMTLGNALAAALFLAQTQRQLGGLPFAELGRLLARLLLASVPAGLAAWGVILVLSGTWEFAWLHSLAELAAGGVTFVLLFGILARLLRIDELNELVGRFAGRLTRRRTATRG